MSTYLLALSLGSVQRFIDNGRKSQDLCCGSWLLSHLALTLARYLEQQQPGCLIMPNRDLLQDNLAFTANVANVVRAQVSVGSLEALHALIENSKTALYQELNRIVTSIRVKLCLDQEQGWNEALWDDAIRSEIQCWCAWVACATQEDYLAANQRLSALLSARKQTREFDAMIAHDEGCDKSTNDGYSPSVLPHPNCITPSLKKQLKLSAQEQLDAWSVVKRALSGLDELDALQVLPQYPAFSRIIAEPWLRRLASADLKRLSNAYQGLVDEGYASRMHTALIDHPNTPFNDTKAFAFDAEFLYVSRIEALYRDLKITTNPKINALTKTLKQIKTRQGAPVSYGVLLKADGDGMGRVLNMAKTIEQSHVMTIALCHFAEKARLCISQHQGQAIYTGGDDVLALLSVEQAFECATQLAKLFQECMQDLQQQKITTVVPTLSVGLAIGHFVQPIRQLQQRAKRAERLAKQPVESAQPNSRFAAKNALAICLGVRAGYERVWRCRWDDQLQLQVMAHAIAAYREQRLPSRFAQQVRQLGQQIERISLGVDEQTAYSMASTQLRRLQKASSPQTDCKSNSSESAKDLEIFHKDLQTLIQPSDAAALSLTQVADLLLIAQWLAQKADVEPSI